MDQKEQSSFIMRPARDGFLYEPVEPLQIVLAVEFRRALRHARRTHPAEPPRPSSSFAPVAAPYCAIHFSCFGAPRQTSAMSAPLARISAAMTSDSASVK